MWNLLRPAALLLLSWSAAAQVPAACPRPEPKSEIEAPFDLRSSGGKLAVEFTFRSSRDVYGNLRYCYMYRDVFQSPTLRMKPGDELVLMLKNELPAKDGVTGHDHMAGAKNRSCADGPITIFSTNLHFHGLNVPPLCHQDDVLHTVVQPSSPAFEYRLKIPTDQPPGLYWYHPHPHGYTEGQVLGGASGAIVVEGIERARPEVVGLPERILILRDQLQGEKGEDYGERGETPNDITINFVPIVFAHLAPASLSVHPEQREFWRVLNASADTYFNLRLLYRRGQYDFVAENLKIVALDGAPAGAADIRNGLLVPPGGRAEFIITTPPAGMPGRLTTLYYDTGPDGTVHPERIIASIVSRNDFPAAPVPVSVPLNGPSPKSAALDAIRPARTRKLYFSEDRQDRIDPKKPAKYFITVEGDTPKIFDMNFKKPDVIVKQGTVEDWEVENRAREAHDFHIHQVHFQVLERDGVKLKEPELRDTIDLPFWDGKGPYPSVKLRMDFRSPEIVGTFIYHCHILEHEDGGMMGSIEVKAR